jgi:hypothetical protein
VLLAAVTRVWSCGLVIPVADRLESVQGEVPGADWSWQLGTSTLDGLMGSCCTHAMEHDQSSSSKRDVRILIEVLFGEEANDRPQLSHSRA